MLAPSITVCDCGEAIKLGGETLAACSSSPFIISVALLLNLYVFRPVALHLQRLEQILHFLYTTGTYWKMYFLTNYTNLTICNKTKFKSYIHILQKCKK